MNTAPQELKASFFREHVLPALFVFLIPVFSVWFFSYAESWMDGVVLKRVQEDIRADGKLSAEDKIKLLQIYDGLPISRVMASSKPEAAPFQRAFEPTRVRYAIFRWMKRIAWICLGTIVATLAIVGLSVRFSFRSHAAQYHALRIGWPVLRTSAAIQVVGQAVLAVALSFWVTAIFFDSYFVKIILLIGIIAFGAVAALMKAIFAKVNDRCEVEGEMISEGDAPGLWQRVREMAAKLETPPPDRIIVGIAPSFFVTEHPVVLGAEVHQGRTLYLSLPMLKIMGTDEADAVLGHELAHFSGHDTLWSRKISPLLGKFALYLQLLGQGLSLMVAHFMFVFWKLYNLSIRKLGREREFRADEVGSSLVSKDAMKRALVKVTCYCEYRAQTEGEILNRERVDESLNLPKQLEQGYPAFLTAFTASDNAVDERVPHPFDTHPTLNNRLAELGFEAGEAVRDQAIQRPVDQSWYGAITTATALEERMWAERQELLKSFHSQGLAWRTVPKNEEELAIVLAHFPHAVFRKKDGAEATLDFDRIKLSEWEAPILFKDIINLEMEDAWPKRQLTITHRKEGQTKPARTKLMPGLYEGDKADLLAMLGQYYGRYKTAEEESGKAAAQS